MNAGHSTRQHREYSDVESDVAYAQTVVMMKLKLWIPDQMLLTLYIPHAVKVVEGHPLILTIPKKGVV